MKNASPNAGACGGRQPDGRSAGGPVVTPDPSRPAGGQSRMQSWAEVCANTAIGCCVAILSQLAVFPLFGIHVPLSSNVGIGLWFTAISIVRSFVLRRAFNALHLRQRAARG